MKKFLVFLVSFGLLLCIGGVSVYANETSNNSDIVIFSSSYCTSISTGESSSTSSATSKVGVETQTVKIGSSSFDIVVNQDDCFTGLNTLVSSYGYNLDDNTKNLLLKELTTLVIDITTNGGYTLDTFKTAFLEILVKYGIEITEDVLDAVLKYSIHYFNDDFEQEDNEQLLVWIGGTLGMMTTLFLTSQQGGVHRGY